MSHRRKRIEHVLRERIADVIGRRVRDPRLELLTITDVEVSPDLSYARVFYRAGDDTEAAERALVKARPFIRRELAGRLELRRVPELDFRVDRSVERGARVEAILDELAQERRAREGEEAS